MGVHIGAILRICGIDVCDSCHAALCYHYCCNFCYCQLMSDLLIAKDVHVQRYVVCFQSFLDNSHTANASADFQRWSYFGECTVRTFLVLMYWSLLYAMAMSAFIAFSSFQWWCRILCWEGKKLEVWRRDCIGVQGHESPLRFRSEPEAEALKHFLGINHKM